MDIFKNIDKIDKVEVKSCIMHGEKDEVVPFSNGKNLYDRWEKRGLWYPPLWIPNRGHNDMPERMCLAHAKKFIDSVKIEHTSKDAANAPATTSA